MHLLARLTGARLADLHRLGLRGVCEGVLNGVYRMLRDGFGSQSPGQECGWGGEKEIETDLYVEPKYSPVFGGDGVRLVWHAYSQTGPSTKYARGG